MSVKKNKSQKRRKAFHTNRATLQIRNRKESELANTLLRISAPGRRGVRLPGHPLRRTHTPRHPESRHRPLLPVARLPLSFAAAAPAGTGKARGNQPLPALQWELRARAEVTGVGLAGRTRFPPANRPLPRGRRAPHSAAQPPAPASHRAAGRRKGSQRHRGKGRVERGQRAAGQGPPEAHPGQGRAGQGWRRLLVVVVCRWRIAAARPLSAAPCNRRDATGAARALAPRGLSPLSLPPVRPTGEGSRAVPACAAAASVAPAALPDWKFPQTLRQRKRPRGRGGAGAGGR